MVEERMTGDIVIWFRILFNRLPLSAGGLLMAPAIARLPPLELATALYLPYLRVVHLEIAGL